VTWLRARPEIFYLAVILVVFAIAYAIITPIFSGEHGELPAIHLNPFVEPRADGTIPSVDVALFYEPESRRAITLDFRRTPDEARDQDTVYLVSRGIDQCANPAGNPVPSKSSAARTILYTFPLPANQAETNVVCELNELSRPMVNSLEDRTIIFVQEPEAVNVLGMAEQLGVPQSARAVTTATVAVVNEVDPVWDGGVPTRADGGVLPKESRRLTPEHPDLSNVALLRYTIPAKQHERDQRLLAAGVLLGLAGQAAFELFRSLYSRVLGGKPEV
jgi:hypothetical protein